MNTKFQTPQFQNVEFVLMDIEGTTTRIDFVKEVLFPYSAKEMRSYIEIHRDDGIVLDSLHDTGKPTTDEAIKQLLEWIKNDVKHPALKTLQGLIWEKGYKNGDFQSHLYEDVLPAWERWKASGLHLGIYSSGSVAAQKLLFSYSEKGNVLKFLDAHFDLGVGGKRDVASYAKIANALKLPAEKILFLSDVHEELDAAQKAGLQTGHIVRPGTSPCPNHLVFNSFDQI